MKELTDFGLATLRDRYLLKGETVEKLFERVAFSYAYNEDHAKRMFKYISNFWFMPASPILTAAGSQRGLPISCYLNEVQDNLESIAAKWNENVFIAANGGGIGTSWSNVRGLGENIDNRGSSSGTIPFLKVMDSLTLAINQGSLRRGSSAAYLHINHPEIEEFIKIRKVANSADPNRKCLNLNIGVVVDDEFMQCVEKGTKYNLISRKNNKVIKQVDARNLFVEILQMRLERGEPYILYEGNVNSKLAPHHHKLGLKVTQSNLCSEIVLPTGLDHLGNDRTAICCLGSLNAEHYDEWKDNKVFIKDCMLYLDCVLDSFIDKTKNKEYLKSARYSAMRERSIGLGLMGFHSYLQKNNIAFESFQARIANKAIFKHIRSDANRANYELAKELGSCPDAIDANDERRFSYMLAIAPTANISIIAGGTSPCIEPWSTNIFTQKTLSGSFEVKNKFLVELLKSLDQNTPLVWDSILKNLGSVQHLDFLTPEQKSVFKTAFEIDQRHIIDLAADRNVFIDQAQSLNLFINTPVHKQDLFNLHYRAWKSGVKSLYYLRSLAIQRPSFAEQDPLDFDECLSCQ